MRATSCGISGKTSCVSLASEMKEEIAKMKKMSLLSMVIIAILVSAFSLNAQDEPTEHPGRLLFKNNCSPCHPDGGNIINAQKTLHKKDLDANKITTAKDIVKKMRNPGPFPTHPQDWAGMKMFDQKAISDQDANRIADYILKTFK
jgi:cytochrome c6